MIAGTSTGAIIALALAAGVPARSIYDLYLKRGGAIFPRKRDFGVFGPAYTSTVLATELNTMFGPRLFGHVSTRLCIPSADGKHGDVAVLKTPHHPNLKRDWAMKIVDIALASSAAPTFLRVHDAEGYQFIDGGIWANNPVMVGIVDALSCYNIHPAQIRVLSIGSGTKKPLLGAGALWFGGAVGWLHRGVLIESMTHYSSMNADGQAGLLIGREHIMRVEPSGAAAGVHMTDHANAKLLLPPEAERLAEAEAERFADLLRPDRTPVTFFHGPRSQNA
jgi:uncharacterized protein